MSALTNSFTGTPFAALAARRGLLSLVCQSRSDGTIRVDEYDEPLIGHPVRHWREPVIGFSNEDIGYFLGSNIDLIFKVGYFVRLEVDDDDYMNLYIIDTNN